MPGLYRIFLPLICVVIQASVRAEDIEARGWAPPTPEDIQYYHNHASRVDALHLNALALRRLHAAQLADSLSGDALLVRRPGRGVIARPLKATPAAEGSDVAELDPGYGIGRLPREVDNSTLPSFPKVFNQGRLNSCTAVVSTYYQLTHMTGIMRGWDQKRAENERRFSPAWTYNLINGGQDRGGSLIAAYAALHAHGALSLADFPYRESPSPASNYRRWPSEPELWRRALTHRIEAFGLVEGRGSMRLIREMKRMLLNGHVLAGATHIDGWNRVAITANPDSPAGSPFAGEALCTRVMAGKSDFSHAVTVVGYNDDIWFDFNTNGVVDPGERGAFKVVNSWGTQDWNRGFRWLHYSAVVRLGPSTYDPFWTPAFWLDRLYWLVPARDYLPARVVELELASALREQIDINLSTRPSDGGASQVVYRLPNQVFSANGGPFGFSGGDRPDRNPLRVNIDLTPGLLAWSEDKLRMRLSVYHPANAGALLGARLIEPGTGRSVPLALKSEQSAPPAYEVEIARDASALAPAPRPAGLPAELRLRPGEPASLVFTLPDDPALRVTALSSHAKTLDEEDITLTPEGGGRYRLDLYPRPRARGSALVIIQVTNGWSRTTAGLRLNLETETNTAPTILAAAPRLDGEEHVIALQVRDAETPAEKLTVYFDTPRVEAVKKFTLSGSGETRELRVTLAPDTTLELALSVFDGELIGETGVTLASGDRAR